MCFHQWGVTFQVRQNLAARQTAAAESQKMKQFRKQRKLGKKAQVCVKSI